MPSGPQAGDQPPYDGVLGRPGKVDEHIPAEDDVEVVVDGVLRDLIAASNATARPRPETDASGATTDPEPATTQDMARICPCCGGRMRIIETFASGARPRSFTAESAGIDSS